MEMAIQIGICLTAVAVNVILAVISTFVSATLISVVLSNIAPPSEWALVSSGSCGVTLSTTICQKEKVIEKTDWRP